MCNIDDDNGDLISNRPLDEWSFKDVEKWLKSHPSLSIYAKKQLRVQSIKYDIKLK